MLRVAIGATAIVLIAVSGSLAEPVTYRCSPAVAEDSGDIASADELVIDHAAQSLDLRVAASMETDAPLNWLFTNRPDEGLGPDKMVMDVVFESTVGGGFRGSTAFSFILDGSDFAMTMMSVYGAETYRWTCSA
jgi:hypothetical protein